MDFTIISVPQPKWIKIEFSEPIGGFDYACIRREKIIGLWGGTNVIGVSIKDGKVWEVSYNGYPGTHRILSIDGIVPQSNDELAEMIEDLN